MISTAASHANENHPLFLVASSSGLLRLLFWFVLSTVGVGLLVASHAAAVPMPQGLSDAGPAELYAQMEQVLHLLERIKRHMGAATIGPLNLGLEKAASHDLYFQAVTLFIKTNRLSFEITRLQESPPPLPATIVRLSDVQQMIRGAKQALERVAQELKIAADPPAVRIDRSKTATDVFKTIQTANRQLGLLLERRFTPSDVYEKVTLAVGYAACHLATYPGAERIPAEPTLESDKQPGDVYFRLLRCMGILADIYNAAGLEALQMDASQIQAENLTPGDVYDLASAIVARLDFLHKHFGLTRMPPAPFYPGRRYPSDVYQRAGLLEAQLSQLIKLIQTRGLPSERGASR